MAGAGNAINEGTTGICGFTGTAFTGTSVTNHNVLLGGSTTSTLTNVAPAATAGVPLVSNGSSSDPSFTTAVVAGGGTGRTTLTAHGVLVGNGTTAITQLAAGSAGQVLQSGGAAADPAYSTATYPSTASSTGVILRANGTNWVATTATYPTTTTANQILYSSATSVIGGLATANRAVLTTTSGGVPQLTALATDGQLIIGSTGGAPAAATLSAADGIIITNGSNSITVGLNLNRASVFMSSDQSNVTGDGTQYTVLWDTVSGTSGITYASGTGIFTLPNDGTYYMACGITVTGLGALHVNGFCKIDKIGAEAFTYVNNPTACKAASINGLTNAFTYVSQWTRGCGAGSTIAFDVEVAGSTKTVGVAGNWSSWAFIAQISE